MNVNGNNANTKLANTNANKQPTLRQWVEKISGQIKNALPSNITPERMVRIAMTAITKDPKLAESTPESFMGALLTSAQLGLECNTPLGQAFLIPYRNNKKGVTETQFQMGYQGLIDLCYRTGQYKKIVARVVYEGDDFDYSYGLEEKLVHRPKEQSDNPVYVYALYELKNGASAFEVMSWEAVMKHAQKYSQSVKGSYSSPWQTDPISMAIKTVLKKLLKYAPKAVEVAEAVNGDSAIIKTNIVPGANGATYTNDFDYSPENVTDVEPIANKQIDEKPTESTMSAENYDDAGIDAAFEAQAQAYDDANSLF